MGVQFAALGRLIYERAKLEKRGTEVDSHFFMQYDEDLRAIRDTAFLGEKQASDQIRR
jgi:hypothetical protein